MWSGAKTSSARLALLSASLVLIGAGCGRTPAAPAPAAPDTPPVGASAPATKEVNIAALPGAHAAFRVTLAVPEAWAVEVVPELEAVNLYDPTASGDSPREQSQIFLRHFRAGDFLTLQTVGILERSATTVAGRPAVHYVIEKNPGVPPFAGQPSWRNARHRVTDVRLSDASPSEFLVMAQNPALADAVFDSIVASLRVAP